MFEEEKEGIVCRTNRIVCNQSQRTIDDAFDATCVRICSEAPNESEYENSIWLKLELYSYSYSVLEISGVKLAH